MTESFDVVVVGAGLAGLSCALQCHQRGLSVCILEASDRAGGRVRTDVVDGYRLDRGFQVFNTAYAEAARLLDFEGLELCEFTPGALVYSSGARQRIVNPLRRPRFLASSLMSPLGTFPGRAALGLATAIAAASPEIVVTRGLERFGPSRDCSADSLIQKAGAGSMEKAFLQPFLGGVLLSDDLSATSARFAGLVWRSFARGRIVVPALGMGEIPAQIAATLPEGSLRVNEPVRSLGGSGRADHVHLESGASVEARAIVVATDPVSAERLLPGSGLSLARMRGVTTFWHRAASAPLDEPVLLLDGEDHLVANSVVMSSVSPAYRPAGSTSASGALVATSVLGCRGDASTERQTRQRLATLYDTSTSAWDLLAVHEIAAALPAFPPGRPLRRTVRVGPARYVCGDHRDTPSIQGALVSGRRGAEAIATDFGLSRS